MKVYSGIAPPRALLEAMAAEGKIQRVRPEPPPRPSANEDVPPPMPARPTPPPAPAPAPDPAPPASIPAVLAQEDEPPDDAPPSYEDAMAEGIGPIDGPRPEYNPPNTSADRGLSGPVTDAKAPVDSTRDEKVYSNNSPLSRASSESVDMLPTTPGSRPESLADESWIQEPEATTTSQPSFPHKGSDHLSEQSQYGAPQQPGSARADQRSPPGRPGLSIRTFSTGVPNRRPVPGNPGSGGASQS